MAAPQRLAMVGAAGLLAEAHGSCLRLLAEALQADVAGLSIAARAARRKGIVDNQMARTLERLDIATGFVRHITITKGNKLVGQLQEQLDAHIEEPHPAGGQEVDSETDLEQMKEKRALAKFADLEATIKALEDTRESRKTIATDDEDL